MTALQIGKFKLNSGRESTFKLECDVYTREDWEAFAALLSKVVQPFGKVVGIPRGGLVFAECMTKYLTYGHSRVLVVDDVWTTGNSMTKELVKHEYSEGWVLYARGNPSPDCRALFTIDPALWSL